MSWSRIRRERGLIGKQTANQFAQRVRYVNVSLTDTINLDRLIMHVSAVTAHTGGYLLQDLGPSIGTPPTAEPIEDRGVPIPL